MSACTVLFFSMSGIIQNKKCMLVSTFLKISVLISGGSKFFLRLKTSFMLNQFFPCKFNDFEQNIS